MQILTCTKYKYWHVQNAGYSSRRDTPNGEMVNATGVLNELDAPGHFSQALIINFLHSSFSINFENQVRLKAFLSTDSRVLWFWGSTYRLQCHLYRRRFRNRVRRKYIHRYMNYKIVSTILPLPPGTTATSMCLGSSTTASTSCHGHPPWCRRNWPCLRFNLKPCTGH